MAIPDYEESQFEGPLMAELADSSRSLFSPGNVAEYTLGFDGAVLSHHPLFWSLWSRPPGKGKTFLPDWLFDKEMDMSLPKWRLNLFVQAKRPQWMMRSNAEEWDEWKKEYFRFSVREHQQDALQKCAERLGRNGLVVYASPAIRRASELHVAIANQNVVKATSFVEAERLTGYRRYSYAAAGVGGKRHGSVEDVPSLDILGTLDQRLELTEPVSFESLLRMAQESMLAAMEASPKLWSAWNRYEEVRGEARELLYGSLSDEPPMKDIVSSFVDTGIACWILRIRWLVSGLRRVD